MRNQKKARRKRIKDYHRKSLDNPLFQRKKEHRQARTARRVAILGASVVLGCGLAWVVAFSPLLRVRTVEVQAGLPADLGVLAGDIGTGKALWLLPRDHMLLYDTEELRDRVTRNTRVLQADVSVNWRERSVRISGTMREPVMYWVTQDAYFEIDQTGRVLSRVFRPQDIEPDRLTAEDAMDTGTAIGQNVLDTDRISHIRHVARELMERGTDIDHVEASTGNTQDFTIHTTRGWHAMLPYGDADAQLARLDIVLSQAGSGGELDYIDLRFEDRLFYK